MINNFISGLYSIHKNTVGDNVKKHVKNCLLDYLSVTLMGSRTLSSKSLEYVKSIGDTSDACIIIGLNIKSSLQTSALINGMNSHVLELDDGHRQGALHVGSTIFSALLPVAEKEDLSFDDFLYGAIIGYEATVRLACAVQPGNKLRGYHATGTCGTVGAAVGIAAALGFDKDQMKSAISAAVTCAAGVLEMQEDNSDFKPLNVGRAAMDAISAAYLGKARFTPPIDAIGGKRGFLKVMTDTPKIEYLTTFDPNTPLAITQIYMKTYAACRHTHPAIEAALALREKHNISSDDIESINVEAYKLAVAGHDHTDILGVSSAKMSLPFSVALAIHTGSAGMDAFNENNVKDDTIVSLTQKVSVVENEELSALVPNKRASILNITLKDGSKLSHRVDYPKGEPENPLSDVEIEEKFISLAMASGFSYERCKYIIQTINQSNFKLRTLIEKLN